MAITTEQNKIATQQLPKFTRKTLFFAKACGLMRSRVKALTEAMSKQHLFERSELCRLG